MNVDLIFRIIGMLVFSLLGVYVGNGLSRTNLDQRLLYLIISTVVGAVLGLAQTDGVLLFNGEEAVVQTVAGETTFATDWEDWDDMPEVAALRRGRRGAPLAQPLL